MDSIWLLHSLWENLSDAYQIPVWIYKGELSDPPRLVLKGIQTRDASSGQLCQSKRTIDALNV